MSWWMIIAYIIIVIFIVYIARLIYNQMNYLWNKKRTVRAELARQRSEVKAASDELRQPMARMASIIGTLSETEHSIEEKEQLNALHFQKKHIHIVFF